MLNSIEPTQSASRYSKTILALTVAFAAFIVSIIVLANQGSNMWLFRLQGHIPYFDKVGHFVLVGGMAFFANLALQARQLKFARRQWLTGSLLVAVVFTAEEFMQLGLAHRTFDLGDLTADFVGIFLLGRMGAWMASKLHPSHSHSASSQPTAGT